MWLRNLLILSVIPALVLISYFIGDADQVIKESKPSISTPSTPKINYADALAKQSKSVKACVKTLGQGVYKYETLKFKLEACNYNPNATSSASEPSYSDKNANYDSNKYTVCYGKMTKAHKARGLHESDRVKSINIKETVCEAFARGEINDYEGNY